MSSTLQIIGLGKQFVLHERGVTIQAFSDVSFEAAPGAFTGLVGASGSGKSSLLKCIYRTYLPDAGQLVYRSSNGVIDLASVAPSVILELRRNEIRFVSQFLTIPPRQSTIDVVAKPLLSLGHQKKPAREMAREMLQRVGLQVDLWNVSPYTFSGGERQLVNIAMALIVPAKLLLLDEPTASLDAKSKEKVLQVIEQLKDNGVTLIGVFHDQTIVERLADVTIHFRGGVQLAS
ncbi:MAG: phosphonate C-P lyase system protein PhnL [Gemmataceae bacterium]